MADELGAAGYRVVEANNADEALGALQSGILKPHLVVTDIRMPGRHDGMALARVVRAALPVTKIVVVSGNLPAWDEKLVDAMLAKPYDPAQLLATVSALLEHSH